MIIYLFPTLPSNSSKLKSSSSYSHVCSLIKLYPLFHILLCPNTLFPEFVAYPSRAVSLGPSCWNPVVKSPTTCSELLFVFLHLQSIQRHNYMTSPLLPPDCCTAGHGVARLHLIPTLFRAGRWGNALFTPILDHVLWFYNTHVLTCHLLSRPSVVVL